MAEKSNKASAAKNIQRKDAPKNAADAQGHAVKQKAAQKKAAPAAADTEGHIASRMKGSSKR